MARLVSVITTLSVLLSACGSDDPSKAEDTSPPVDTDDTDTDDTDDTDDSGDTGGATFPASITITGVALNPEGIEYDPTDQTFLLSSLNAGPIVKVALDGTYTSFTSGEDFPLSTAGLEVDHARNRLLVAGLNGTELMDDDPETKGVSFLRVYNLQTGVLEQDVHLSALAPEAPAYMANDIAVDLDGNAYVSDWFAGLIYKVTPEGSPSVFWTNTSGIAGGPNGLDFHPDGYLLVSVINDGSYSVSGLVKVPLDAPEDAVNVDIPDDAFAGFDGMVLTDSGVVVGVTNDGSAPGGNVLLELSSTTDWTSAQVDRYASITTSTTVAVTEAGTYHVINQDFADPTATTWTIEQIDLPTR